MENIRLGLRENWKQFTLLLIINAFVGGMLGMERSILPRIAEIEFHIAAKTAIFSFIIVFGIVKAMTNYFTGFLVNKIGRKNLLVIGWLVGIPVPFILMYAPDWNWIVAANILLGINQGLTWSTTVMMKMDLVAERQRGLAMGLNEFAGYIAVAAVAFLTGWIAGKFGLRPYPFYLGVGISILGFLCSLMFIRDTRHHVMHEATTSSIPHLQNVVWETTWKNRNLGSVTQAGFVNNLNDAMVWGLVPILVAARGFSIVQIGIITAIYPAVWGIGQLVTGAIADRFSKKAMLVFGMLIQGVALLALVLAATFNHFIFISILLGIGTAIVYPTFLATIAEHTHPDDRARGLGIFRFWRDLGYAAGAVLTGIFVDRFGSHAAILFIGSLTILSSFIVEYRMEGRVSSLKIIGDFFQKIMNYRHSN